MPLIIYPEKGAWPCHVTHNFFKVPANISGLGKATSIKFGMYIHSDRQNKSLNYFFRKRGVALSRDSQNF